MFSRFDTKHACDRRTDRRTDGIGVAYTAISIASRGKNEGKIHKMIGWRITQAYIITPPDYQMDFK